MTLGVSILFSLDFFHSYMSVLSFAGHAKDMADLAVKSQTFLAARCGREALVTFSNPLNLPGVSHMEKELHFVPMQRRPVIGRCSLLDWPC